MSRPNPIRALALVSLTAGALLLVGALPAFATPGLTASGTGTVLSPMSDLVDPTSNQPDGVAIAGGTTYVSNPPTHSVDEYNAAGGYLGTIGLGSGSPYPVGIVASPDGTHIFVVDDSNPGIVDSIDVATSAVTPFAVANSPFAITMSPDGGTFYVISNSDSLVYAYNSSTGAVLFHSVSDGLYETGFHLVASPDGTMVFESMRDPQPPKTIGGVRVLSTTDLSETGHKDVENASGLAMSPDGSKIYVGTTNALGTVSSIIEFSSAGSRTVLVGADPESIILSPDGKWLYSIGRNNGTLDIINTSTFTSTQSALPAGEGKGLAISPDGLRLYSTNSTSGKVLGFSIAKLTLTSAASVSVGAGTTTLSAQITDGTSPIADYTTNSVTFDILNSSSTVVATATVAPNAAGAATVAIDLSKLPVGTYSVRATLDPIDGTVVVTAAGFSVGAALAATGTDALLPTGIAFLLLLAGATALLLSRRRRTA